MARLQDDFLDDLDDLADSDEEEETSEPSTAPASASATTSSSSAPSSDPSSSSSAPAPSAILSSPAFIAHRSLLASLSSSSSPCSHSVLSSTSEYLPQIADAVSSHHTALADTYSRFFPGLEDIATDPGTYAKLVEVIGHDATELADRVQSLKTTLSELLPPSTLLSLTVSSSMSPGRPLTPAEASTLSSHLSALLGLLSARAELLSFTESQTSLLAPNVTALVGPSLAAQLLCLAGGLPALSRIPACNLLVFGAKPKTAGGINQVAAHKSGLCMDSELVRSAQIADRPK
ncbi:hypothetical protein TeGR_g2486, partial [Tetraparma gracilis]